MVKLSECGQKSFSSHIGRFHPKDIISKITKNLIPFQKIVLLYFYFFKVLLTFFYFRSNVDIRQPKQNRETV